MIERTKLLICGSRRNVSDAMVSYAKRAADHACNNGWLIYAGDAIGVDMAVAQFVFNQFIVINFIVIVGLMPMPRHEIAIGEYVQLPVHGSTPKERYTARDRYMIENVDKVMCIWNSKSKSSGTYKNYLYACELNKQAWLINEYGKIIERNDV